MMTEKLLEGTLCAVCEDLATGNHYSVPSCNGCKTFFRRAVVNNRAFACMGNEDCPVNKGVRCACRHCRFKKCLLVGMDKNSIQNDRDRIGYTKRTRRSEKTTEVKHKKGSNFISPADSTDDDDEKGDYLPQGGSADDSMSRSPRGAHCTSLSTPQSSQSLNSSDPILDRLATFENNFILLLSRAEIVPYGSLDEALSVPSRFNLPITVKMSDPIAMPKPGQEQQKTLFWRSRIIALYIDWAKTFPAFKNLPHSDKVALITNHASSYMIMCKAFRTPERFVDDLLNAEDFLQNDNMPNRDLLHNSTGLTPVMSIMIDYVMKPFRRLNITTTEFAALQAIMFFDPDTDGLDSASQRNVYAEQKKLLTALFRHISHHYLSNDARDRFASILLRIPTIRKVAAKKNEALQIIDMFNIFNINTLFKETALGIRPSNLPPTPSNPTFTTDSNMNPTV